MNKIKQTQKFSCLPSPDKSGEKSIEIKIFFTAPDRTRDRPKDGILKFFLR
jgi:hypothetical protein